MAAPVMSSAAPIDRGARPRACALIKPVIPGEAPASVIFGWPLTLAEKMLMWQGWDKEDRTQDDLLAGPVEIDWCLQNTVMVAKHERGLFHSVVIFDNSEAL